MNPSAAEIHLTMFMTNTLASPIYNWYLGGLPLTGNERVLDVGSGSGACARYLARRLLRGGGHVTCLDVSPAWLDVARERLGRYPNVAYQLADATQLFQFSQPFDAALIHFVLHDIAPGRPRMVLADNIYRALRPGGQVYLREPLGHGPGISTSEINTLFAWAGFARVSSKTGRVPLRGSVYTAIFERPF